jgi:septum formation protein
MQNLILASTSPFRKDVLGRLHLPFATFAPAVNETPQTGEKPRELVARLAELKARAAKDTHPNALIIGSDQMAVIGDEVLGKPGNHDRAVAQLSKASGQRVDFLTGLCLYNSATDTAQTDIVMFSVTFRDLTATQIENYLQRDKPYNCSGSFKSEGFGIALLDKMEGSDPTAVIGLPLIRLVRMLEAEGVRVV